MNLQDYVRDMAKKGVLVTPDMLKQGPGKASPKLSVKTKKNKNHGHDGGL